VAISRVEENALDAICSQQWKYQFVQCKVLLVSVRTTSEGIEFRLLSLVRTTSEGIEFRLIAVSVTGVLCCKHHLQFFNPLSADININMAFFGLTALGPQNTFEECSAHHRNLQIFEDLDFQLAWDKVNGSTAKFCHKSKIGEVLRALFHGPLPKNDIRPIEEGLERFDDGTDIFTLNDYMKVMNILRDEAEQSEKQYQGKIKPECEFISSSHFKESLKKNCAIKNDLRTKTTVPLTGTQEV
jgi:hypothetical protein